MVEFLNSEVNFVRILSDMDEIGMGRSWSGVKQLPLEQLEGGFGGGGQKVADASWSGIKYDKSKHKHRKQESRIFNTLILILYLT